ncbi:MAG: hypothetical protein LUE98_19500 [Tannerellaceae bacterium]|nr:hypothetical protein [Tannerellaceae bacterium]
MITKLLFPKKGYKEISIPAVQTTNRNSNKYYARNIAYILKEFIPDDKNKEYIFHLNFMSDPGLVTALKKLFKCKIVLVAHYTEWSFSLLGNEKKLLSIMKKQPPN